jgi:hypothetical protein
VNLHWDGESLFPCKLKAPRKENIKMDRKEFLVKMIRVMKGFNTAQEIKEEYDYLLSNCDDNPQITMIVHIKNWLRFTFNERDPQFVIWERLEKEGL